MAGLTLDAGALIAAERGDRRFWAFWKEAERRDVDVSLPAPVLAQVWRGSRGARTAIVVRACAIDPMDERRAKQVGLLCARSGLRDIVDAAVVVGAAERGDDVLTSDPGDLRRLASHTRGMGRVLDLSRLLL